MNLEEENKILKKTIDDIIDMDQGIYPYSIYGSKNDDYEKRTLYMDGWNDASIENTQMITDILYKNGVSIINDEVLVERKYNVKELSSDKKSKNK